MQVTNIGNGRMLSVEHSAAKLQHLGYTFFATILQENIQGYLQKQLIGYAVIFSEFFLQREIAII